MPIYEFRCRTCDTRFEALRPAGQATAVACPEGHTDAERLLSLIAPTSSGADTGGGGACCAAGCGCGKN